MKNARTYEKAVRKFLTQLPRRKHTGPDDPMQILLESILLSDATSQRTQEGLEVLGREFVDLNELRVSPPREIVELIGEDYPRGREKAVMITTVLNNLYIAVGRLSLEALRELPKRELRRRLGELGLDSFAVAAVTLRVFDGHAVPVDRSLVEVMELEGLVHPGSTIDEVQGFLERVVSQKEAPEIFEALRTHVEKQAKVLEKHRREAAQAEAQSNAPAPGEDEGEAAHPKHTNKQPPKPAPATKPAPQAAKPAVPLAKPAPQGAKPAAPAKPGAPAAKAPPAKPAAPAPKPAAKKPTRKS